MFWIYKYRHDGIVDLLWVVSLKHMMYEGGDTFLKFWQVEWIMYCSPDENVPSQIDSVWICKGHYNHDNMYNSSSSLFGHYYFTILSVPKPFSANCSKLKKTSIFIMEISIEYPLPSKFLPDWG